MYFVPDTYFLFMLSNLTFSQSHNCSSHLFPRSYFLSRYSYYSFFHVFLQVGGCHFVYPNATHTRFQHSLGVGYLARKFAKKLQEENPDKMDDKDVICVMIAGLCHDLGKWGFWPWAPFLIKCECSVNEHYQVAQKAMFISVLYLNLRAKYSLIALIAIIGKEMNSGISKLVVSWANFPF